MNSTQTFWSCAVCLIASVVQAQVPQIINYQGRIAVHRKNFDGTGLFKFSLVNSNGLVTFWSNDGSGVDGMEPLTAVPVLVDKGAYAVALGDTRLSNMVPISPAVFSNSDVRLRVWFNDGSDGFQQFSPDQRIYAVGYAMMAASVPDGAITTGKLADQAVTSEKLALGAVGSNQLANAAVGIPQLAPGAALANLMASGESGVASGGIILSFDGNSSLLTAAGYVNVGPVPLLAEKWESRSTSPGPRQRHTAVWTGSEMLVWGGGEAGVFLNTGGRYNYSTDTWQPIATSGPSGRWDQSVVWTGTEMLVWGGRANFFTSGGNLGDGGRYNPTSDSWISIAAAGAPSPRSLCAAVWTGTELLIWGGVTDGNVNLGDGARYNPASDTWTPIISNGAPSARCAMAAVWTGTELVIWGGGLRTNTQAELLTAFQDGAKYDPATDHWKPLATNGAPPAAAEMVSVWSGKEMIVWGGGAWGKSTSVGATPSLATGGRYDPATDSWKLTTASNAPATRVQHRGVWTGKEMLIWGGNSNTDAGTTELNTGGRYNPETDSWVALTVQNAPSPRVNPSAVWAGEAMLIFGGYPGSGFNGLNSNYAWTPGKALYLYQRN